MTRRPSFWIAYAALAALALAVAWELFPLAIPLVNLDVTMSRSDALAQAQELAAKRKLAPEGARSAVRFSHDGAAQSYIELEGGGKAAFGELVKGGLYAPYWWDVRVFMPGEVSEVVIRFKPDGRSNGFGRRVPETYVRDEATKALDAAAARALAEERAGREWTIDLAPYKLLEQSQQTRPGGRIDHVFVYERAERLGDARIRMRLGVAGDELTEVAPYIYIPESFERRFRELRSANDAIAGFASVAAGLLYGLGGCVLGALWLARTHGLVVRPALRAGLIVGGLLATVTLSAAPAAWFGFDTAQSTTTFWLRQAGAAFAVAVGGGLGYALVFMTAESLTRRAFPAHPQLWRVWSKDAAPTRSMLGRTLGGYLFVPIELALVAAFYYATNRWLGWWQPSEVLTDPNILSYAMPALMPIAVSLQAGFMEECLFRAVPLALGALIGARFGHRSVGDRHRVRAAGRCLRRRARELPGLPVVFAARRAHRAGDDVGGDLPALRLAADDPAARAVRSHAVLDTALSRRRAARVDTARAGGCRRAGAARDRSVAPRARRRPGGSCRIRCATARWATAPAVAHEEIPVLRPVASRGVAWVQRSLPAMGLVGLVAWIAFTPMRSDVPALAIDRQRAESAADTALRAREVTLAPEWRRMSTVRLASDEPQWSQHTFVWREAGPTRYRALVGSFLAPPLWDVRYAMFEGDVAARAEEWRVTVEPGGSARQIRHALPEARPGARLANDEARAIAERALAASFGVDPAAMKWVAAEQRDRPSRTDWAFTFADPRVDVGKDGEARMSVAIAGDEVVGAGRYVHVPESWLRTEREREGRTGNARIAAALLFALAAIAALGVAVRAWMHGQCDNRAAALALSITFAAAAAGIAVMWPTFAIKLKTTEPVAWQVLLLVSGLLLATALGSLAVALATGVGVWAARTRPRTPLAGRFPPWAGGAAAALAVAGAGALAERLVPPEAPLWPSLPFEAAAWPWAAAALHGIGILSSIGVALFVLHILDRVTASWTRRAWLAVAVVAALIAALVAAKGSRELGTVIAGGLVAGAIAAAVVYGVLRFDARTLPGYVVAAALVSGAEDAALDGTAAGWIAFAVYAAVALAMGWAAVRYIALMPPPPEPQAEPAGAAAT